ncbi:MAG: aldehyde dehydrogenase family protein [Beutenbergiaceae bacterium]
MNNEAVKPFLCAGQWIGDPSRQVHRIENPATAEITATVVLATTEDVDTAVTAAAQAQRTWGQTPPGDRAKVLFALADLLERDTERLAAIIVAEMGKPIREARGEVGGAANFCRFFAGLATVFGGEVLPSSGPQQELWLRREPVGVVAAILPWNFPLALSARKCAPALVAGNAVVLKPAETTPLSALAFAELALQAGVPAGVLSVLPGDGEQVGSRLVAHPGVDVVTMTGSVPTGQAILRATADQVKTVSLELGGKAPFIVFDDADLDAAVEAAVAMRMMNNGQTCVCNERTYVQSGVFDEFVRRYTQRVEAMVVGDPMDEATEVGPKASASELENVANLVDQAVAAGATVVTGGTRLTEGSYARGYWYAPTVLTDLAPDSVALRQEIFGPVTPIVPFDTEEQALELANDTDYGLSSYLYTSNFRRVMRMSAGIASGEVFVNRAGPEEVNGFHAGWGRSGLGGDDGTNGLKTYTRTKAVYVDWSGGA